MLLFMSGPANEAYLGKSRYLRSSRRKKATAVLSILISTPGYTFFFIAEVEVGDADWEGKRCPRIIDISQRDSVNLRLLFS